MRVTGARFLSGPNLHDDASGVVIGTDVVSLPPAGRPILAAHDGGERIFSELGIAGTAGDWAATAALGRAGVPGFLSRLAAALVTPVSIFPSGGKILAAGDAQLLVFLRCEHEKVGLTAWDCACKAVIACLPGEDDVRLGSFQAALAAFRRVERLLAADPSTTAIAREARRLDIPWYRLSIPGQHVQIGQGHLRRYLYDTMPDGVGATSRLISQDKFLTNRIIGAAGVPVLPMMEVRSESGAVAAAERLGYPVVVKPCHGGQGRGVSVHLTDRAQVAAAYRLASADRDSVVVEKFAPGHDHRVLMVEGRVVGVASRMAAADANVSTGGTAIDATDAIHPDNKAILERAAGALDLSIVGMDFLTEDITRSWRETGGVVLGLNASPDLRPHRLANPGRGVEAAILRSLLPRGSDGRIPTCAITGSLGKTTTANMVARILAGTGLLVGRCTTVGVTVGDERQRAGECTSGWHARNLLFDRRVEAGVFELARGGLLHEGMGIEDVDVGAVLNVYDNHIGLDGITSRADLARIKSIVARRARRALVLNAEDPLCLAMRQGARAERLYLVAADAAAPALRAHVDAGGCAVCLRGSPGEAMIVLAHGGAVEDVIDPAAIPATLGGRHRGKVWNAMFATAIAQAMGAALDDVRQGLRSFKPDLADSQGRFSIIDRHPFRVVLDHAFGQPAIEELANAVRGMPAAGRKWVYVLRTGQVPDELIRAHGRALSGAFDRYVCTNSTDRPRPDPQTVPGLLRDGILAGGVAADAIVCIADQDEALRYILGAARPGDLVVINTSLVDKVTTLLESFDAGQAAPASGMPREPGR